MVGYKNRDARYSLGRVCDMCNLHPIANFNRSGLCTECYNKGRSYFSSGVGGYSKSTTWFRDRVETVKGIFLIPTRYHGDL